MIDAGLKLAVTPLGTPEADNVTAELNPAIAAVVIVDVPKLPCATLTVVGDADMVKSGVVDDVCCVIPRNASVVLSAEPLLAPTKTIRCVPVMVICRAVLLVGQAAAVQTCPFASAKLPGGTPDTVITPTEVLPSRNSTRQLEAHCE
jgi:hypothetical protein